MTQPIGIFDSGIGGLTVAHAIKVRMPNERIIYFGDTAHLPYGDKSEAAIQAYSVKITNVLLEYNCKAIIIACNSASSAAYSLLREYTGSRAKVINVIDPMVEHVIDHYSSGSIGLIGTKRTIESNIYYRNLTSLAPQIELKSLATPLLAHAIEEGFIHNRISQELIQEYLEHSDLQNINALILGCTHYPLIKKEISEYYQNKVAILDSAIIVADHLYSYLQKALLLNEGEPEEDIFMVSDYTEDFEKLTKQFFTERVKLRHHILWE